MPRSSTVLPALKLELTRAAPSPGDLSGVMSLPSISHLAIPLCHTQAWLPLPFTPSLGLHTTDTGLMVIKIWAAYPSCSCTWDLCLDCWLPMGRRWARKRPPVMELTGAAKLLPGLPTSFHNILRKIGLNLLAFHHSYLSRVFFLSVLHGTAIQNSVILDRLPPKQILSFAASLGKGKQEF